MLTLVSLTETRSDQYSLASMIRAATTPAITSDIKNQNVGEAPNPHRQGNVLGELRGMSSLRERQPDLADDLFDAGSAVVGVGARL